MFTEHRLVGTSPGMWADNFLGKRSVSERLHQLRMRADPRWREIQRRVPQGAAVLDAGCGLGEWVEFLGRQGYRATGLDYSEDLVNALSRFNPARRWIHGSVQAIPAPDAGFDALVSWGVVEHDPAGPRAALKDFFRVLKPGGWAFVSVPLDSPVQRASSERQFSGQRDHGDFFQYFFTRDELADELRAVGFRVDSVDPCSSHYALAFPDLYLRVIQARRPVQLVATTALNLYAKSRPDCANMIMAVAQRPLQG